MSTIRVRVTKVTGEVGKIKLNKAYEGVVSCLPEVGKPYSIKIKDGLMQLSKLSEIEIINHVMHLKTGMTSYTLEMLSLPGD